MNLFRSVSTLLLIFSLCSCAEKENASTEQATPAIARNNEAKQRPAPNLEIESAKKLIIYGNASIAQVRRALTEKDTAELTNTVHALFSMRWHRGVFNLLYKMWTMEVEEYPELNWKAIEKEPTRIALASTLNRIQITKTEEFQNYIRSFKEHEHEFIRAQVVVALGFNGDPVDVPYLNEMAEGDNDYVAQSAIAGLGLMNNNEAKQALIKLGTRYLDTERGAIVNGMLRDGYKLYLKDET